MNFEGNIMPSKYPLALQNIYKMVLNTFTWLLNRDDIVPAGIPQKPGNSRILFHSKNQIVSIFQQTCCHCQIRLGKSSVVSAEKFFSSYPSTLFPTVRPFLPLISAPTGFYDWGLVTRWAQLLLTSNYYLPSTPKDRSGTYPDWACEYLDRKDRKVCRYSSRCQQLP